LIFVGPNSFGQYLCEWIRTYNVASDLAFDVDPKFPLILGEKRRMSWELRDVLSELVWWTRSARILVPCIFFWCVSMGKRKKIKNELAGKPGSVMDSHSSGMSVAEHLKQPTRIRHGSRHWIPIWSCSEWGLPCHLCYHRRGALLPHHFNLTGPAGLRRCIFCDTFHRFTPSRRYLALYPVEPGLSSVDKTYSDCLASSGRII